MFASSMLWACGEEKLDSNSIFEDEEQVMSDFDKWLYTNFTVPYNIEFKYKFDDKESNSDYNLAPAKLQNSIALAKLIKYLWTDVYDEMVGKEFLASYSPRLFHLIGSPAWNSSGSIVLGTAEGGLKVTLYNVNSIDVENPDIDELNYWFFKTMHHEFAHILHQMKSYTTDFNLISAVDYQSGSWVNISDDEALKMGFISPYGSSESQEDFVELLSVYVTHTAEQWQELLDSAVLTEGDDGYVMPTETNKDPIENYAGQMKILEKFSIVEDYLKANWGIDIHKLRDIVVRRSADVENMDLTKLD